MISLPVIFFPYFFLYFILIKNLFIITTEVFFLSNLQWKNVCLIHSKCHKWTCKQQINFDNYLHFITLILQCFILPGLQRPDGGVWLQPWLAGHQLWGRHWRVCRRRPQQVGRCLISVVFFHFMYLPCPFYTKITVSLTLSLMPFW